MSIEPIYSSLKKILGQESLVCLGILFGSIVENKQRFESDVDLAVAGERPLTNGEIKNLVEKLSVQLNRPIDLIDLHNTNGTLLHQVLTRGKLIYCDNRTLYAELIKKMLFNQADMMPYHDRILKERRERWISE